MNDEAKKTDLPPQEIELTREEALESENMSLKQMMLRRDVDDAQRALGEHSQKFLALMEKLSAKYKVDMRLYELRDGKAVLSRKGMVRALQNKGQEPPKEE